MSSKKHRIMLSEIFKDLSITPYKRGRSLSSNKTFRAAITPGYGLEEERNSRGQGL